MAVQIPARYSIISVRSARGPVRKAMVTAYNYCFERCYGVYVDYPDGAGNQLVWLHQIEQSQVCKPGAVCGH